jgi:hypothetical protein
MKGLREEGMDGGGEREGWSGGRTRSEGRGRDEGIEGERDGVRAEG